MKATSLRIGNLIEGKGSGEVSIVDSDTFISIEVNGDDLYDPILLTEEWLIKFGWFYLNGMWRDQQKFDDFEDCLQVYHDDKNGYHRVIDGVIKKLDFVHVFQNWVFALTGEELTIEEKIDEQ